jgi:hypothetical protein
MLALALEVMVALMAAALLLGSTKKARSIRRSFLKSLSTLMLMIRQDKRNNSWIQDFIVWLTLYAAVDVVVRGARTMLIMQRIMSLRCKIPIVMVAEAGATVVVRRRHG